ncbi:MAG: MarR family transcriptional regulator [Clostridia bacterium]|nr:MarR family transcriptional regulator [Clostridia bacterium]MDD4386594.1 MarR family transcriptional regulator [Clostridia bacterium]
MKKPNNELIEELMRAFMDFKRNKIQNIASCEGLTHNEKMILFSLHDISKDNKVSLSVLRERMKLAPSTITPIITLLEEKELIERNIDKNDRRNIFLKISPKGEEQINRVQFEVKEVMFEYIKYMGEDDTKQLIRLISKTTEFFTRKEDKKS